MSSNNTARASFPPLESLCIWYLNILEETQLVSNGDYFNTLCHKYQKLTCDLLNNKMRLYSWRVMNFTIGILIKCFFWWGGIYVELIS